MSSVLYFQSVLLFIYTDDWFIMCGQLFTINSKAGKGVCLQIWIVENICGQ